jgi:hypothetical protein
MSKRKRKLSKAECGRLGGKATRERHGVEHFRAIGKKGFMVTVARHWNGDKIGYMLHLQSLADWQSWERGFAALAPDGNGIVCREMPPLPGDDGDPADWRAPFEELARRILSSPVATIGGS